MNERITDAEKLRQFMSTVPCGELTNFIDSIVKECKVRRSTYMNWRSAKITIPKDCKKKIEKLAGQKIWGE